MLSLVLNHKILFFFWGSDINELPKMFQFPPLKYLYKKALNKAESIIVVSPEMKKKLIEIGCSKKILVQRYSIDLTKLPYDPSINSFINKKFKFFSIRWIQPNYNIKHILNIFEKINKKFFNSTLTLVGPANELFLDNSYFINEIKPRLNNKIKVSANSSHQSFIKLIKSHDIVITMAIKDGSPVSVLESMAIGRLVIAGENEYIRSLIKNGKNGFLVNLNNSSIAVESILKILKMNSKKISMILMNARKFVEQEADSIKEFEFLNSILKKL